MKIELISVCDMWEKLKDFDNKSVWNDDSVFESVSMDDFVDDVNEMYVEKEGKGGWYLSDFENISDCEVSDWVDKDGGECIERYCEIMDE